MQRSMMIFWRRKVSPTSIRSRILKAMYRGFGVGSLAVSPTSIRSRILKGRLRQAQEVLRQRVSPTSIRSRILKGLHKWPRRLLHKTSFTHVDPFEDTESLSRGSQAARRRWFHPRRSVRGY